MVPKSVSAKLAVVVMLIIGPIGLARAQPLSRENIEWCDLWITHANETRLPRVLLLGDSIARGYDPEVEKRLAGVAYVNRLATSAFITDPMLLTEIALVLDSTRFDVIHFNNGMHGWQHSEEEYRQGFSAFLEVIRKHAPHAKLIWASTTALKEPDGTAGAGAPIAGEGVDRGKLMVQADLLRASDARIRARNAIALEFVARENIPVDDLFALTVGRPELHNGSVHFNASGIALQADQVAAQIRKLLVP
jgi:lysophospholipase L1-like esterase